MNTRPHAALQSMMMTGRALLDRGDFAAASQVFEQIIRQQSGLWEAQANLGMAYKAMGQMDRARTHLEKAHKLAPRHAGILAALANVEHLCGNLDDALRRYGKAIAQDRRDAGIRIPYGSLLAQMGRFAEALDQFRQAYGLAPQIPVLPQLLGVTCHQLGDYDQAIEWLTLASQGTSPPDAVLTALASSLLAARRPDEAEICARRVTENRPDFADGWSNLAAIQAMQGQWDAARSSLDRAWTLSGDILLRLKRALTLPVIPASRAEIQAVRDGLCADLQHIAQDLRISGQTVSLAEIQSMQTNFLLSYHGVDNRPLQQQIADLYRQLCPDLSFTAAHLIPCIGEIDSPIQGWPTEGPRAYASESLGCGGSRTATECNDTWHKPRVALLLTIPGGGMVGFVFPQVAGGHLRPLSLNVLFACHTAEEFAGFSGQFVHHIGQFTGAPDHSDGSGAGQGRGSGQIADRFLDGFGLVGDFLDIIGNGMGGGFLFLDGAGDGPGHFVHRIHRPHHPLDAGAHGLG